MKSSFTKRLILLLSIAAGAFVCLEAQQHSQYTQFMLNRYAHNPAYGGLENSLSITTGLRTQWNEFDGAPKTQFVNVHLPMYILAGSVGLALENDELGAFKRTQLSASYNYVYESVIGLVSGGVRAGVNQVRLEGDRLRTPDGVYVDQSINHNDPLLSSGQLNGLAPTWGMGFYLVNEYFQGGLSFDNVPENNFTAGSAHYKSSKLFSIFASTDIYLSDILLLRPVVLIKSDGVQTQTDIGSLAYYEKFLGGVTLRGFNSDSFDSVNFIAGVQLNEHFRLSYSYDFGINDLRSFHDGSHEFVVNYNLNKKIKTGELPRVIYNPRYN